MPEAEQPRETTPHKSQEPPTRLWHKLQGANFTSPPSSSLAVKIFILFLPFRNIPNLLPEECASLYLMVGLALISGVPSKEVDRNTVGHTSHLDYCKNKYFKASTEHIFSGNCLINTVDRQAGRQAEPLNQWFIHTHLSLSHKEVNNQKLNSTK